MKDQTCCFTGHRAIPAEDVPMIKERLEQIIARLAGQGVRFFGAGGARGFDTLAAQAVLKHKRDFPQLRLILVLPCKGQTQGWPEPDRRLYDEILRRADKVVYTSERYQRGCMQKRNRHLADHSGYCVYYLTKPSGGTAYTVRYAAQKGLTLLPVLPAALRLPQNSAGPRPAGQNRRNSL